MDPRGEHQIAAQIKDIAADRITIVVTHRLETRILRGFGLLRWRVTQVDAAQRGKRQEELGCSGCRDAKKPQSVASGTEELTIGTE
jgi:hypothetical protein